MGKLRKKYNKIDNEKLKVSSKDNFNIIQLAKVWLNKMKSAENYTSKPFYFSMIVLGFLLYTIAYVFFYSYYFSGKTTTPQSVLQLIINPIPFNFKSLVALAFLFISIIIIITFITNRISDSLRNRSKLIFLDIFILIIVLICSHIFITLIFIGKPDFEEKYLTMWLFVLILSIYFATAQIGKLKFMFYGFIGTFPIIIVVSIVNIWIKYPFSSHQHLAITIISMLFIAISLVYLEYIKIIVSINIFIILYFILSQYLKINSIYGIGSILLVFSIIILMNMVNFLWKKYFVKFFKMKKDIKIKDTCLVNKYKTKSKIMFDFMVEQFMEKYRILLIYLVILLIFSSGYYSLYSFGQTMGKNMSLSSYDEIMFYYDIDSKEEKYIMGTIVSYKDGIYYISNKNRELVTIKGEIVKSEPYKK